jgi:hypothetical protein
MTIKALVEAFNDSLDGLSAEECSATAYDGAAANEY